MANILITVVTVVYNSKDEFEKTVESVINQSYKDIEYIIIDGKSVDGTVEIIEKNKKKISNWLSEPDNGIYEAMNKALKIANGDFLIFMNAGDIFCSSDTILKIVDLISDRNTLYYGNALYFYKTNDLIKKRGGHFSKYRLAKTNICHQTIFYPRVFYVQNSFNVSYCLFADWEYNMKAYYKGLKFSYINYNIVYYDATGVSATQRDIEFEQDFKKLIFHYLGFMPVLYLGCRKLVRYFNKQS